MTHAELASYLGLAASVLFALIQACRDAWYFAPPSCKAHVVRWLANRCAGASMAATRVAVMFQQLGAQLYKFAHYLEQKDAS